MMRMVHLFSFFVICIISFCCSEEQGVGPGYRWSLFKNTAIWPLAKAVKNEDTVLIRQLVLNNKMNVNFQEPKFGESLLFLSVHHGKLASTKCLLQIGANINIRDSSGSQVIHEATKYISLRENVYNILKILIENGADVNSRSLKGSPFVPLEGAVDDYQCFKLLFLNGADCYVKIDNMYLIWFNCLISNTNDGILNAKYLIVDKKMQIPDPIGFTIPNNHRLDIKNLVERLHFPNDSKKREAKEAILDYISKQHSS